LKIDYAKRQEGWIGKGYFLGRDAINKGIKECRVNGRIGGNVPADAVQD